MPNRSPTRSLGNWKDIKNLATLIKQYIEQLERSTLEREVVHNLGTMIFKLGKIISYTIGIACQLLVGVLECLHVEYIAIPVFLFAADNHQISATLILGCE